MQTLGNSNDIGMGLFSELVSGVVHDGIRQSECLFVVIDHLSFLF
jgi:hypothetical protein